MRVRGLGIAVGDLTMDDACIHWSVDVDGACPSQEWLEANGALSDEFDFQGRVITFTNGPATLPPWSDVYFVSYFEDGHLVGLVASVLGLDGERLFCVEDELLASNVAYGEVELVSRCELPD